MECAIRFYSSHEMARLDAENNVQDAIKKTTDLSIASQNQAIKSATGRTARRLSLGGLGV